MATRNGTGLARLPAFDTERDALNGVIEAVKGTRNKFKYDPETNLFIHDSVLPAGASYPFDFGFVPSTKGEDGDPLDVLILMDEPAFVGAVIPSRLVGAIEATQREESGEVVRNDRLLAVACKSGTYRDVKKLDDLPSTLLEEVEHFWISYNQLKGKEFTPIGRAGPVRAKHIVEQGAK